MNYVKLSWKDIEKMCDDISNQIKERKLLFNIIVSVGRGGLIPARLLSDRLNIPDVYMYNIKLYKNVAQRFSKPITESFNHNVENKSILLIDDILDSGITMQKAYSDFTLLRTEKTRTATLLCKDHVITRPTFFGDLCKQDDWIIFPWEKEEFKGEKK